MRQIRKLTAALLVFAMTAAMGWIVFAAEPAASAIVSFGSAEGVSDAIGLFENGASMLTADTTIHDEDAESSAKWDFSNTELRLPNLADNGVVTDWTPYGALKLRLYSDTASGNVIWVRPTAMADTRSDSGTDKHFQHTGLVIDWTGWKTVTLPLRDFEAANMSDMTSIQGFAMFAINTAGGGNVYFDDIWLEELSDDHLTFHTVKPGWWYVMKSSIAIDTTNTYNGAAGSLKWNYGTYNQSTNAELRMRWNTNTGFTTNWEDYTNLNLRVYSDQASGKQLLIRATATAATSGNNYYSFSTNITQTEDDGWVVWSIPLSTFSQTGSVEWNSIQGIAMFVLDPQECGGSLWIDEIWLEKAEPSAQIAKFDTEDSLSLFNGDALTADTEHTYGEAAMSAKWISTTTERRLPNLAQRAIVTDWTSYDTVKLRLYSNESNKRAIQVRATPTTTTYENNFYMYEFYVNWTGWREVSIPLSAFTTSGTMTDGWSSIQGFALFSLDGAADYYVSLDEIWLEKNHTDSVEVKRPQSVVESGTATVSTAVTRHGLVNNNNALPVLLIAAVYQDDRMVQYATRSETVMSGMLDQEVSLTMENVPNGAEVKAFVWNGWETMEPYSFIQ